MVTMISNYSIEELCENNSNLLTSIRAIMLTDIYRTEDTIKKTKYAYGILITFFVFLAFINNFLCLYTLILSKKIRITSLGIYLILYCIVSLITMIGIEIDLINILYFDHNTSSTSYDFFACSFLPVLIISMASVSLWLSTCVAIERILIESSILQLFSSRKHSLIISIFLFLIISLSHIHRILYRHIITNPLVNNLELCVFTPSSSTKIIDNLVEMLHLLGPCLIHFLCAIWVLFRIVKHKIYLNYHIRTTPTQWLSIWKQQIYNHKDFFIPPLLIIICIMPHVIIFHLLITCSDTLFRMRLNIILNFLVHIPEIFTFFIYIYPSKIYWEQFLQTKFGELLRCYCCFTKVQDRNRKLDF
ncbi:unnamed protein product [Adineta steineri]|uniref:G-protein coupled receptors family 1 profile domain-containing protein n=1 Tax=Adineta steineri TaxID=433720 RepID=A0A818TRN4_9BILA|nr:unnamed protein product [Adineta steineri]